jgi:hypothetical protein
MAEPVSKTELPEVLAQFADQYPQVWEAYNQFKAREARLS